MKKRTLVHNENRNHNFNAVIDFVSWKE